MYFLLKYSILYSLRILVHDSRSLYSRIAGVPLFKWAEFLSRHRHSWLIVVSRAAMRPHQRLVAFCTFI